MSDEKNADMVAAEHALVEAGYPELAAGLWRFANSMRNYVQGDFGKSMLDAVERIGKLNADMVRAAVDEGVTAALSPFRDELAQIHTRLDAKRERLNKHDAEIAEIKDRLARLEARE